MARAEAARGRPVKYGTGVAETLGIECPRLWVVLGVGRGNAALGIGCAGVARL